MRKIFVSNEDLASVKLFDLLGEDEYFEVILQRDSNGETYTCAFGKREDEYSVYFLSDLSSFDGAGSELRYDLDYDYSWDCGGFKYASELINDCSSARGRFSLIGVVGTEVIAEPNVQFINNAYRTDNMYRGIHSYHSGRRYNESVAPHNSNSYRIGVELEVECKTSAIKSEIGRKFESNWLLMERDGSLSDNGIEFITIPMLPKDIKAKNTWYDFIEYMSSRASSWNTSTCGLHIHIGREILGKTAESHSETTGKLLFLYHHFLKDHDTNIKIYGRARAYNDNDGKVKEGDAVKLLGNDVLAVKSVKDKLKSELTKRTMRDRYFDINLRNEHTIEFRKGRGSLNVDRIISVIEYSELMCKYAKQAEWSDISAENFFEFVKKSIKRTSPLQRYFNQELDV